MSRTRTATQRSAAAPHRSSTSRAARADGEWTCYAAPRSALPHRVHDLRGPQELGADDEARGARGVHVDAQANALVLGEEADDDVGRGGDVEVRDGECARVFEIAQDRVRIRARRTIDEENLTRLQISTGPKAFDDEPPTGDLLAPHSVVERTSERVVTEHADDERLLRIGQRLGRPAHELREIEKKDGLDLVLRGLGGRSEHAAEHSKHED